MNVPSSSLWASAGRALLAALIALPFFSAFLIPSAAASPVRWAIGAGLGLASFALAWKLLPTRQPIGARALLLCAVSVGLVLSGPGWELDAWLAPVSRDAAGGSAQLLLTFGLLSLASWTLQDDLRQGRRWIAVISVAAGFVLSMVLRGALPLFVVIVYLSTRRQIVPPLPISPPSSLPRGALRAGVLLLCGLLSAGGTWSQRARAPALDPALMSLEARAELHLAEGNRPRALFFARQWLRAQGDPAGPAALLLARIAWSLGDRVQARETAQLVQLRGRDPELRARAMQLLERWAQ